MMALWATQLKIIFPSSLTEYVDMFWAVRFVIGSLSNGPQWLSLLPHLLLSVSWTFQWMERNKTKGMSLYRLGYKEMLACPLSVFHCEGSQLPCCDLLYGQTCMARNRCFQIQPARTKASWGLRGWSQKHPPQVSLPTTPTQPTLGFERTYYKLMIVKIYRKCFEFYSKIWP